MSSLIRSLKHFAMTSQLMEHQLDQIEQEYGINLGRDQKNLAEKDPAYYPQIEQEIRTEAARMASHYETFYSLEKTIKGLISDTMESAEGQNWWVGSRIPPDIRSKAGERQQTEIDSGITPRSYEPIDFCTFGELGEIIKKNWDIFGSIFSSIKAVERVMANLNTLRGPIAHCSPLAGDEVIRLQLSVKDWFRLME